MYAMKMQSKILSLAIWPLVILGTSILIFSNAKINRVVNGTIENGLKGAVIAVEDTFNYVDEGDYYLDKSGNLCKGSFNITKNPKIADNIKEETNMDITVFYGKVRYMTSIIGESGNRVVGTTASAEVVEKVLENGESYFSTNIDFYGRKYFGYYQPLRNADGEIVGMIFAGINREDAKSQINSILWLILTIIIGTAILGAIILSIVIRKLVKALRHGQDALEELAQGNLEVELDTKVLHRRDEIGNITRSIEKLKEELISVIGSMKSNSENINTSAIFLSDKTVSTSETVSQVEKAVGEIAEGATGQAEATQHATDSVVLMGNMVEETAKEAETMNANARNMRKLGEEAFETLHELKGINSQAKESIDVIYEQTNTTNQSAQKIKEATNLITSIASETNLLSLNASIEAARAGEQGRGFAVVASQIQKLAEQSNESAKQIEEIISYLITDSDKAVKTMDVVKQIMDKQSHKMDTTDERFAEVLKGIALSIESIEKIVVQAEKMDKARIEVVDIVQNLTSIAEENAASTEETSASITEITNTIADISEKAEHLKEIAAQMEESMKIFRL
jgi:methyl-accepting chemotaxis protein